MKVLGIALLSTISFFTTLVSTDYARAADLKGGTVVVLFTGFSGSSDKESGMKQLNDSLQKQLGNNPNKPLSSQVFQHFQQQEAFNFIKSKNADKVILVGHSFGGDSVIELANDYLKPNGIDVDLSIQIDSKGVGDQKLPSNIKKGINYWQEATDISEVQGAKNVEGAENINIEKLLGTNNEDITHTNIDNNEKLREIIEKNIASSVPEPLTILASATALGFGSMFKKQYSKKQKEHKS